MKFYSIPSIMRGFFVISFLTFFMSTSAFAISKWITTNDNKIALANAVATKLPDGKVLVAGGADTCAHNQSELFSPSPTSSTSGTWVFTNGFMTDSRVGFTVNLIATQSGGVLRALVIGGKGTCAAAGRRSAELFNEDLGTWSSMASMTDTRFYHTATALNDGSVLVTGGSDDNNISRNSVELYNPFDNTWSSTPSSLLIARQGHTATKLQDGRVIIVGGITATNSATATAEIYDPSTGLWSFAKEMHHPRSGHKAVLLPNGNVLVVGGSSSGNTAEIYNPSSNIWTSTAGNLTYYRTGGHTVTLISLPDGTQDVLVAGGGSTNTDKVELYDYVNDIWSLTDSMNTGRIGHTATLLDNGNVLVTNGYSPSGYTKATEIYTP